MKTLKEQDKATVLEETIEDNTAKILLRIDPEISYFKGHFEDYPILAGVVQINWAIHYGKSLLGAIGDFSGMEVIKFQQPILPNDTVLLTLKWDEEKGKLYFWYTSGDNINHASGRIKLERTS